MNFSEKLKQAIADSGLKKKEVAERAEISPVLLSKYIKGEVTPKSDNLTKIAKALGLSPSFFYEQAEGELVAMQRELQNWRERAIAAENKLRALGTVIPLLNEANNVLSKIVSE